MLLAWAQEHPLLLAVTIGLAVRIGLLLLAVNFSITNEEGYRVSPLLVQPWIDFQFYVDSLAFYQSKSLAEIAEAYIVYFSVPFSEQTGTVVAGPVFPVVIWATGYGEGNTLPLALVFLGMSCALVAIWLFWLHRRGLGLAWLLLFAVIPNPLWYTLNISSDMLFAILVALFYWTFTESRQAWARPALLFLLGTTIVLTRSNGPFVILFAFLFVAVTAPLSKPRTIALLAALGVSGLLSALLIYPEMSSQAKVGGFKFMGIHRDDYIAGLFPALPDALDFVVSWTALSGAKVLHFVGLRPSIAGIPPHLLFLRAGIGLILLPGFIYACLRGRLVDRLFILCFSIPVLLGPTLDRYNLPILPILYFYGVLVLQKISAAVSRKTRGAA